MWENHMNLMACKHTCSGIIGANVPQVYYLCKVDSGMWWIVYMWQLYSFSVLSQHELDKKCTEGKEATDPTVGPDMNHTFEVVPQV